MSRYELIVKHHDKSLFSQQTTCLNYGKICTRQAGQVCGQPNSPVFFPTRIGERASPNHAHCEPVGESTTCAQLIVMTHPLNPCWTGVVDAIPALKRF